MAHSKDVEYWTNRCSELSAWGMELKNALFDANKELEEKTAELQRAKNAISYADAEIKELRTVLSVRTKTDEDFDWLCEQLRVSRECCENFARDSDVYQERIRKHNEKCRIEYGPVNRWLIDESPPAGREVEYLDGIPCGFSEPTFEECGVVSKEDATAITAAMTDIEEHCIHCDWYGKVSECAEYLYCFDGKTYEIMCPQCGNPTGRTIV